MVNQAVKGQSGLVSTTTLVGFCCRPMVQCLAFRSMFNAYVVQHCS